MARPGHLFVVQQEYGPDMIMMVWEHLPNGSTLLRSRAGILFRFSTEYVNTQYLNNCALFDGNRLD